MRKQKAEDLAHRNNDLRAEKVTRGGSPSFMKFKALPMRAQLLAYLAYLYYITQTTIKQEEIQGLEFIQHKKNWENKIK